MKRPQQSQPIQFVGPAPGASTTPVPAASSSTTSGNASNATKQPSPRGRRPSAETKAAALASGTSGVGNGPQSAIPGALTNTNSGVSHWRVGGGSSAFGPPSSKPSDALENDEPRHPTPRDIEFLGGGEIPQDQQQLINGPATLRSGHTRKSSDELDYSQVFSTMTRGTSPNPTPTNSSSQVRPMRLNSIRTYSAPPLQQPPQPILTSTSEPSTPSLLPEPPPTSSSSRPSSPASLRAASPSHPRPQPSSPQTVRPPSPQQHFTSLRPQSPPQILASTSTGARPRSPSLEGKSLPVPTARTMSAQQTQVGVGSVPGSSASSRLGITPSHALQAPSSTIAASIQQAQQGASKRPTPILGAPGARALSAAQAARSSPNGGAVSAPILGGARSSSTASRAYGPSPSSHYAALAQSQLHPPSPPTLPVSADFVNNLSLDQLEMLQQMLAMELDQRKRNLSTSVQTASILSSGSGPMPVPLRGHRPKEDSLDEIQFTAAVAGQEGELGSNYNRQRTSSQDAGRIAPNVKMFESQVPGEDSRSSVPVDRKPSSPKLKFGHTPPPRCADVYEAKPSHPAVVANVGLITEDITGGGMGGESLGGYAVPDLSRSVDILSPTSAFKPSAIAGHPEHDGNEQVEDEGMDAHPGNGIIYENKDEDPAME